MSESLKDKAKKKLRSEAAAPAKVKPELPSAGRGPRIETPFSGPKIEVPKELQKEVLEYGEKKSASGIRGAPRSELRQAVELRQTSPFKQISAQITKQLPAKASPAPIRLPDKLPKIETSPFIAPKPPIEPEKKVIRRQQVEQMGVKERVRSSVVAPPKPLQLPAQAESLHPKSSVPTTSAAPTTSANPTKPGKIRATLAALDQFERTRPKLGPVRLAKAATRLALRDTTGAAKALTDPSMLQRWADRPLRTATGRLGTRAVIGRFAARALPPVAAFLAVKDIQKGTEAFREARKGAEAQKHLDIQARGLTRRGYRVEAPRTTFKDYIDMANPFTPENWATLIKGGEGYTPPSADFRNIKIYDEKGREVKPTPRRRRTT